MAKGERGGELSIDVTGGHQLLRGFFQATTVDVLVEWIQTAPQRRNEFDLSDESTPEIVRRAAAEAEDKLGFDFNYAILKWYRVDDIYESEAYESHVDPPWFRSIPLVLATLTGSASLIYQPPSGPERSVVCQRNDVILLDSELGHRVTPPTGDGERYYMFLGFNDEQPPG